MNCVELTGWERIREKGRLGLYGAHRGLKRDKNGVRMADDTGTFFCVGIVYEDGHVEELNGTDTWLTVEDYHKARGGRAGNLIYYFPPNDLRENESSPSVGR